MKFENSNIRIDGWHLFFGFSLGFLFDVAFADFNLLFELIDSSLDIHKFVLSGIKRVASRTDFDLNFL